VVGIARHRRTAEVTPLALEPRARAGPRIWRRDCFVVVRQVLTKAGLQVAVVEQALLLKCPGVFRQSDLVSPH
jgi:hypothetical protein